MGKNVVISGYYGYGNFGDEAILYTLIQKLNSYDADITVLSGNPDFTTLNYYVKSVKNFSLHKVIKAIKQSDILISGGGSLLQDATSLKSLLYYLSIIALGLCFRKKVIIFAQGIGPVNNRVAAMLTGFLLKRCEYVSVRDENSLKLLETWNVQANLVCDPIYSFPFVKSETTDTVGVQLRNFKSMNDRLLKKIALQLVKDFPDKKIEVISLQDLIDLPVCNRFSEFLKNIKPDANVEVISGLSGKYVVEKLSKLDYLIGMRFHALLLAMKFGVKSIAINYDIKVAKLAEEYNIPVISMDADEDFDDVFMRMKALSSDDLRLIAEQKDFDWSGIDNIFKNIV